MTTDQMAIPEEAAEAARERGAGAAEAATADRSAPASSDGGRHDSAEGADGFVAHLLSDVQALRARDDELHLRLLEQIERRHAAQAALQAERFKVAALERDLRMTQRQLEATCAALEHARATHEAVRRERDALERDLREIRSSKVWRLGKAYWALSRKLAAR